MYTPGFERRAAGAANNSPTSRVEGSPYAYPPALAIAFLPLTFVPVPTGALIWFTIIVASLIGAAYLLLGLLFPGVRGSYRITAVLGIAVLMALFQPIRASLTSAQVDSLILLLLVLALVAFVGRHDYRAGLWLALAASIKPFVALLLVYFLWKRAYRSVGAAAVVGGLLLLVPALVLGVGVLYDLAAVSLYWSSPANATDPANQSLYGLLLRFLSENQYTVPVIAAPALLSALRWGFTALVLIVLGTTITRRRELSTASIALEYGLVITAALLVSPLAEDIHFTYLAIPLLACLAVLLAARPLSAARLGLLGVLTGTYLYLCLPNLRSISAAYYAHYIAPLSGATVLMTGALLWSTVRRASHARNGALAPPAGAIRNGGYNRNRIGADVHAVQPAFN